MIDTPTFTLGHDSGTTITPAVQAELESQVKGLFAAVQKAKALEGYFEALHEVAALGVKLNAFAAEHKLNVKTNFCDYPFNGKSYFDHDEGTGARIAGTWIPSSMEC
jgi:hypothetical protein